MRHFVLLLIESFVLLCPLTTVGALNDVVIRPSICLSVACTTWFHHQQGPTELPLTVRGSISFHCAVPCRYARHCKRKRDLGLLIFDA